MKPTVKIWPDGTRCVIYGDYESWTRYLIIDRPTVLQRIRALRAAGRAWHSIAEWEYLPEFDGARYGGPGRTFRSDPWRMRRSRRYIVIVQSGGLDV